MSTFIIAVQGGAAAGVAGFIVAGAFKGAVLGAVSGALVSGTIGGITSAVAGNGFWKGFADSAADGFMSGAIIGGITAAISSELQVAKAASYWDKGTFSSRYKSMKYHYTQEVVNKGLTKGNSIVKYTSDAVKFAKNNGMNFTLNLSRNGLQNSWSLDRAFGSGTNGLYTSLGNIITFHYFYMWRGDNMNSIEKNIVKLFLEIGVPNEFLNSPDKVLFDEFLKGKCTTFIKSSKIDNESFFKIISLKNQLIKDINYQNNENVIYFDFMKLVISIMKKYL